MSLLRPHGQTLTHNSDVVIADLNERGGSDAADVQAPATDWQPT